MRALDGRWDRRRAQPNTGVPHGRRAVRSQTALVGGQGQTEKRLSPEDEPNELICDQEASR
jgi:hypothetical protein